MSPAYLAFAVIQCEWLAGTLSSSLPLLRRMQDSGSGPELWLHTAQTEKWARQSSSGLLFFFVCFWLFPPLCRSFTDSSGLMAEWRNSDLHIWDEFNYGSLQIHIFKELQLSFHSKPDRTLSAWWIQMSSQCWNFLSLGFWVSIVVFILFFVSFLLRKSQDALKPNTKCQALQCVSAHLQLQAVLHASLYIFHALSSNTRVMSPSVSECVRLQSAHSEDG